jgi:peroxiredoxin Q/BCP
MSMLIEAGKAAPDFTLQDQHGREHRLKDYRGRWVVLYFYPKDATSGCTTQACQFRDAAAQYAKIGAVVLGVSPDDVKSHERFARKHALPFSLLADPDRKVCTRYGVWQEKSMYGRKYMGVVRTTYLIDPEGKVAHRWDKVKVAGHDQEVLRVGGEHQK